MAYPYTVYTPTTAPGTPSRSPSPVADDFGGDDGTGGGWGGYGDDYDNAFNDAHYDDGDDALVASAPVDDGGGGDDDNGDDVVTVMSAEAQASVKVEVLAKWAAAPQAERDAVAALGKRLTLGAPLTPDDFANPQLALHRMRSIGDINIRRCTAPPMDDEGVVWCVCQNRFFAPGELRAGCNETTGLGPVGAGAWYYIILTNDSAVIQAVHVMMACEMPLQGPPCGILHVCSSTVTGATTTPAVSAAAAAAAAAPSPFSKLLCVVDKVVVAAGEGNEAVPIVLRVNVTPVAGGNPPEEYTDALYCTRACSGTVIFYKDLAPAARARFTRVGGGPGPAPAPAAVVAPAPAPAPVPAVVMTPATALVPAVVANLLPVPPDVAAATVPDVIVSAHLAMPIVVAPTSPAAVVVLAVESSVVADAANSVGRPPAPAAAVPTVAAQGGGAVCGASCC